MCTRCGVVVKQVGLHVEVFPIRCKSWTCPDCSKLRRFQLIREATAGKPNRFITITVNPNWFGSPDERAAALAKAWRLTVAAFRHRWPTQEAEYLAVFEATKQGEPHLHIVWRGGFVPQKWLSAQMDKRMGAPVVDVRAVRSVKKVTEYVSKYISKNAVTFGNCKRYWRSKKYLKISPSKAKQERNKGAIYYRSTRHWMLYLEWVLDLGWSITFPRAGMAQFEMPEGWLAPPCFLSTDGTVCGEKLAA